MSIKCCIEILKVPAVHISVGVLFFYPYPLYSCLVDVVLNTSFAGSNLLIDNEGNLKLADFGLARSFSSDHNGHLTNRVITLWYRYLLLLTELLPYLELLCKLLIVLPDCGCRPPELLLGSTKYGPAVDMWSVGCIFAELLNGKPILPGKNEVYLLALHVLAFGFFNIAHQKNCGYTCLHSSLHFLTSWANTG